ncbi:MAG: cobalamin (vitamin B12) biosynthesis CbiX protein [Bacteroidetes bacterium]|nr:MAG: cobalamin (vitamin B12) biosynthesis CbiX protein [Bacteroidota bacterium]
MKTRLIIMLALVFAGLTGFISSCKDSTANPAGAAGAKQKTGVLLVNHGSRSATWRQALLDLEASAKDSILAGGDVHGVKTAFMEYNEPSIATRLKEFDAEGCTDVIIVPVFLTVSPHSFDDIPTIIGQKEDPQSMEVLKIEKIERYTPKAKTHITPLLDFTDIVQKNILRRVKAISKDTANEGLVMIAYGDETYTKEWSALLNGVGEYVKANAGINAHAHGWCGHIAHYNPDSTTVAINRVLSKKPKAIVVPVLVAHDEMFQVKIIGDGINKIENVAEKITYKPDAILPDPNVTNWVINISREYVMKVQNRTAQK